MLIHRQSRYVCVLAVAWASVGALDRAFPQCAPWGEGANLSNDTGRFAVDAHAAIDASGHVHVVYQSFLDTSGRNYYTTNAGGSWSAPFNIGSMSGKGSAPKIVITPDQQMHAFFGRNDLYHRSKPVNGGQWGALTLLTQGSFIYDANVDSTGGVYIVYGHLFDSNKSPRNGIWGRYLPSSGAWGAEELVYGNGDDGNWPRAGGVAIRGDVVWCGIEVNRRLYVKKRPAGGPWPSGLGTQLHDGGGAMELAFDPTSGEAAALYHQSFIEGEATPWFEVFAKYSYDDGATWTAPENISTQTADIDRSPQATYDRNGNLHVAWEGFCCDHKSRVRYRGRIGGHWEEILQVDPSLVGGIVTGALQADGDTLYLTHAATGSGVVGLYDVFIRSMVPTLPVIHVQPTAISRTLWVHESLSPDAFTIFNGCPGTLAYSVGSDAPWIQASPASGESRTDIDTITLSYAGISQVRAGTYRQTITVSGNAGNSPTLLPVTIVIRTVPPDLDGDEDVDQDDFGILQACFSGPFVPQTDPACQSARFDIDSDVDTDDVAVFLRCMMGPNRIPSRDCADRGDSSSGTQEAQPI